MSITVDRIDQGACETAGKDDEILSRRVGCPVAACGIGNAAGRGGDVARSGPSVPTTRHLAQLLEDPFISAWASEFGHRHRVTRLDALAALGAALALPDSSRTPNRRQRGAVSADSSRRPATSMAKAI
jgi:hypothetical protein